MTSPDIRVDMALLIAALAAEETSIIENRIHRLIVDMNGCMSDCRNLVPQLGGNAIVVKHFDDFVLHGLTIKNVAGGNLPKEHRVQRGLIQIVFVSSF